MESNDFVLKDDMRPPSSSTAAYTPRIGKTSEDKIGDRAGSRTGYTISDMRSKNRSEIANRISEIGY